VALAQREEALKSTVVQVQILFLGQQHLMVVVAAGKPTLTVVMVARAVVAEVVHQAGLVALAQVVKETMVETVQVEPQLGAAAVAGLGQ
jgi:hypothetical protein